MVKMRNLAFANMPALLKLESKGRSTLPCYDPVALRHTQFTSNLIITNNISMFIQSLRTGEVQFVRRPSGLCNVQGLESIFALKL